MKCLDSSSTTSRNVTCAREIEMWAIDRLIPYARNARTHSDAQIAQIAASISEFGFNNPILIDSASGVIAGHGRLLAARKLELREVPVIILDHLSEIEKRAGSTLIASERKARRARLMEIDPNYCDGRSFSEIARERQDSTVEVTRS